MSDNPPANIYRTLFVCTLRQETALSVGGTEGDEPWDMALARDGLGRIVLSGRTLGGALVATARTFLDVPKEISRPFKGGVAEMGEVAEPPSLWEVWNAHAWDPGRMRFVARQDGPDADPRIGAAHRQDTRATSSGGLFDLETLPRGLQWKFVVDVRYPAGEARAGKRAAVIAALALREWQRGRCWIGRRVARGLGWMTLAGCAVTVLPATEDLVDSWPTSSCPDLDSALKHIDALDQKGAAKCNSLEDYLRGREADAGTLRPVRAYVRWPLRLAAGEYRPEPGGESYGLDALSIGGHGTSLIGAEAIGDAHFLRAEEQPWDSFKKTFLPDFSLATETVGGTSLPFVPGSAIAGAIRHYLSRLERAEGKEVLDPVTDESYATRGNDGAKLPSRGKLGGDALSHVFGYVARDASPSARSSKLLVSDACIAGEGWQVALLEKVALDEFRQGAYKGAKFDRMAVLKGAWIFDVVQEIDRPPEPAPDAEAPPGSLGEDAWLGRIAEATELFRAALDAAAKHRVGFGGGEFRAYGHLPLEPRSSPQWAPAGAEWRDWKPPEPTRKAAAET